MKLDVEGRWDDTVCNLVPGSDGMYRKRSYTLGHYSLYYEFGTFEITTLYYRHNLCSQPSYRTVFQGTYKFEDEQTVEGFYNINYRLNSKTMSVFSEDMLQWIDANPSCDINDPNLEDYMNIKYTDCYPLQLVPINQVCFFFQTSSQYHLYQHHHHHHHHQHHHRHLQVVHYIKNMKSSHMNHHFFLFKFY
jgi:hypothetical protein